MVVLPSPAAFESIRPGALVVVTKTIFADPSQTPGLIPPNTPVPIGAIAGGAVGGVVLAIVAVTAWSWWGRCIKRKQAKQRKEAREFIAVRENTRRNASTSGPRMLRQPARSYHPRGRKVKFASSPRSSAVEKQEPPPMPEVGLEPLIDLFDDQPSNPPPPPPRPSRMQHTFLTRAMSARVASSVLDASQPVIMPRPKYTPEPDPQAAPIEVEKRPEEEVEENPRLSRGSFEVPGRRARTLAHMPSAVSSDSWYSTQSGEERISAVPLQGRLLATLRQHLDVNRLSTLTRSTGSMYSTTD
ncbi:hypothetical protein OF83DRAFT_347319 [Amylostereum chailletii]|nr:hypothetical protein OF83DRAFT_347319 [Amylostereum chailletii]